MNRFASIRLAALSVALLLCSSLACAQAPERSSGSIRWTGARPAPVCVYKGVMTDAEIEACTGRPVHFDYRVTDERKAAVSR